MKKSLSVFLLAVLICSSSISVAAQASRPDRRGRAKALPQVAAIKAETRFESTNASTAGRGVLVEWKMESERDNLGFLVYRSDGKSTLQVSPDIIIGSATRVGSDPLFGEGYRFYDSSGNTDSSYLIETISMNGKRSRSSLFAPIQVENLDGESGDMSRFGAKVSSGKFYSTDLAVPSDLQMEVDAGALVADPETHKWVVSQPGAKIGVRREGVYRVSRTELLANGIAANSDPAMWQLYVEGVQQSIIVGANGDYIEFYGKGIDRIESDTQMYYLVVGSEVGKRMQPRVVRPSIGTSVSANYEQKSVIKERTNYLSDWLNGPAENYLGRAVVNSPTTYNFTLSGIDFADTTSVIKLDLLGFSFVPHTVNITLNGNVLGTASGNSRNRFSNSFSIPTSFLVEGSNSLLMSSAVAGDVSFFDKVSIDFGRKFKAEQNKLSFVSASSRITRLEGFNSPNIRIFDVTYLSTPAILTNFSTVQNGSTFGVDLPAARPRLLYAFDDSAILAAASLSSNDPSLLSVPSTQAELVIISYKSFMAEAEAWATYRRNQGVTVKVINVEEIYDEFNYGVLSSDSIKAFLNYATSNWLTPPRYALLIGDASFDSRNYQGLGFFNYVPTKFVDTIYSETGSDEALGDFDGDGLSTIAFGRVATRDTQTVTNALAKVVAFEQPAMQSFSRGAVFAFDEPNGYDFGAMSARIRAKLPADMPTTMVDRLAPGSQTTLINAINTGPYIVNYSGHGTTGAWFGTGFFWNGNVAQLTNANSQSIFTMLTCLNGYFMNLTNKSLAEVLVEATNGGAVASWASTGKTTADVQEIMATRFYEQLNAGNITRMGDLIKDAKTVIPGGGDVRLSWALLGDPMLKVR